MNNTITRQTWQIIVLLLFSLLTRILPLGWPTLCSSLLNVLKTYYMVLCRIFLFRAIFSRDTLEGYYNIYLLEWRLNKKVSSGQPRHSCGQAIETLSVHFIHDKTLCIKYILFVWTNGKYAFLEAAIDDDVRLFDDLLKFLVPKFTLRLVVLPIRSIFHQNPLS